MVELRANQRRPDLLRGGSRYQATRTMPRELLPTEVEIPGWRMEPPDF